MNHDGRGYDPDDPNWRTPEETARLRDEAFARLMKMPPKPQKDMKLGKPKRKAIPDRCTIVTSN